VNAASVGRNNAVILKEAVNQSDLGQILGSVDRAKSSSADRSSRPRPGGHGTLKLENTLAIIPGAARTDPYGDRSIPDRSKKHYKGLSYFRGQFSLVWRTSAMPKYSGRTSVTPPETFGCRQAAPILPKMTKRFQEAGVKSGRPYVVGRRIIPAGSGW
jgi:hypothetical protein